MSISTQFLRGQRADRLLLGSGDLATAVGVFLGDPGDLSDTAFQRVLMPNSAASEDRLGIDLQPAGDLPQGAAGSDHFAQHGSERWAERLKPRRSNLPVSGWKLRV